MTSYFKTKPRDTESTVTDKGLKLVEGQIVKIHYIDEPTNRSKAYVEYDVLGRNASGGAVTYKNCKYVQDISGLNDQSSTVLEENEVAVKGKLSTSNAPENMNGTMVVLAFLDGSLAKPVIIGGFRNHSSEGFTKANGVQKKSTFRGIEFHINKDGEYIITQSGPNTPDGKRSTTEVNTQVKLDKEGTVTIASGNKGLKATYNGKEDKVVYQAAGGPKITIDGKGNININANGTLIDIDGNSGKISLTGQMVDVGAAASALAALGPQLVAWLSTHTHFYVPGSGPITPTQPPVIPPPASVLSTTVKIKP